MAAKWGVFLCNCHQTLAIDPHQLNLPPAQVQPEGCTLCRSCVNVCPVHAFKLEEQTTALQHKHLACVACGLCETACPEHVITLRSEIYFDQAALDYQTVVQDAMVSCARCDKPYIPVMVLSDLDIGMNDWMVPEFEWDEKYVPDRGKILSAEELEEAESFYRYLDVDGDGITYRSLPGTHPKGAYFTRGSGHTKLGAYTEDADEYQDVIDRLLVKWETARNILPEPDIEYSKFNQTAVLTIGSGHAACCEALDRLREQNVNVNYCRVKAFPFDETVSEFIEKHDVVYVVEQNRDAQLRTLLILDGDADPKKLVPLLHYNGNPINADFVIERVLAEISKGRAA